MRMKLIVEYELAERSISLPFMNQLNIVKLSEWNKAKANQWMMNELISWARLKSYYYNSIIKNINQRIKDFMKLKIKEWNIIEMKLIIFFLKEESIYSIPKMRSLWQMKFIVFSFMVILIPLISMKRRLYFLFISQ